MSQVESSTPPLPLRSAADTDGDVSRILAKLEAMDRDIVVMRLLANSTNGFRPFVLMSDALLTKSSLPPRLRELVILRLAAARRSSYEWAEHVPMSAEAGVTDTERAELADGRVGAASFSTAETAALSFAEAAVQGTDLAAAWTAVQDSLGTTQALDVLFTTAWWGAFVPLVVESLGLTEESLSLSGAASRPEPASSPQTPSSE